jgi:hypothetical protein
VPVPVPLGLAALVVAARGVPVLVVAAWFARRRGSPDVPVAHDVSPGPFPDQALSGLTAVA